MEDSFSMDQGGVRQRRSSEGNGAASTDQKEGVWGTWVRGIRWQECKENALRSFLRSLDVYQEFTLWCFMERLRLELLLMTFLLWDCFFCDLMLRPTQDCLGLIRVIETIIIILSY